MLTKHRILSLCIDLPVNPKMNFNPLQITLTLVLTQLLSEINTGLLFLVTLIIIIRTERQSGNTVRTVHFTKLCWTFMGVRYLKACKTTKMPSGKDGFLYEDDFDAVLAIIDAGMFENGEDMESEIVTCIKNVPSRENCSFKWEFCPKVCLSKAGLSRHREAKHEQHSTHHNVSHSDSDSSRSRPELTNSSLMYQKSA